MSLLCKLAGTIKGGMIFQMKKWLKNQCLHSPESFIRQIKEVVLRRRAVWGGHLLLQHQRALPHQSKTCETVQNSVVQSWQDLLTSTPRIPQPRWELKSTGSSSCQGWTSRLGIQNPTQESWIEIHCTFIASDHKMLRVHQLIQVINLGVQKLICPTSLSKLLISDIHRLGCPPQKTHPRKWPYDQSQRSLSLEQVKKCQMRQSRKPH